ncbi:MAG: hypothetical protein QM528_06195 [Phycisphaerales bacterium]|nr:hypothetical protein [Phycisphaerales bacterium]
MKGIIDDFNKDSFSLNNSIVHKIGIILDGDNLPDETNRSYINKAITGIVKSFQSDGIYTVSQNSKESHIELTVKRNNPKNIYIINLYYCFIEGNLEKLLASIINKEKIKYASCISNCLKLLEDDAVNTKDYIHHYLRYDICNQQDRKEAKKNCSLYSDFYELVTNKKSFDLEQLNNDIKSFFQMLREEK